MPCNRTRGNEDKLKYRKIHQNIRRQFCFVRVVKYWHIVFREILKSPFSKKGRRTGGKKIPFADICDIA